MLRRSYHIAAIRQSRSFFMDQRRQCGQSDLFWQWSEWLLLKL